MAQFQELTRILLAASCAPDPTGNGTYFVYTSNGYLVYKHLIGETFGDQDIISKDVPQFDAEDEEWSVAGTDSAQQLHVESKIAGCFLPESGDRFYIFFQDPEKRLICLDSDWKPTVLPADPLAGTPLCAASINGRVQVFYVGDKDHFLHYLAVSGEGVWVDNIVAKCVFDESLRSLTVAIDGEGNLEIYILTVGNVLLHVGGGVEGVTSELGKVNQEGKFVANKDVEAAKFIFKPIIIKLKEKLRR
ncbi:hypothetical protein EIP86_001100 [Pleurotus ostreatoroseus]|nr:hypothetical protein EIP86_001100 [Pleurotus ostreatoroseus]